MVDDEDELKPISTGYIERLLADPPSRIPFGPKTQLAFRELLEHRARRKKGRRRSTRKSEGSAA